MLVLQAKVHISLICLEEKKDGRIENMKSVKVNNTHLKKNREIFQSNLH
jgi:hypothetical protein